MPTRPPAPPPQPPLPVPAEYGPFSSYREDEPTEWPRWWIAVAWFWLLVDVGLAIYWLQSIGQF